MSGKEGEPRMGGSSSRMCERSGIVVDWGSLKFGSREIGAIGER